MQGRHKCCNPLIVGGVFRDVHMDEGFVGFEDMSECYKGCERERERERVVCVCVCVCVCE